jgi:hypothetical protein
MSDPWVVQEEREARIYFAQSRIEREEKTGNGGNTYFEMTVFLTPIEPEKQITENRYFNFHPAWQKVITPSVQKLVQAKKIDRPSDMEQEQFVAYRWTEYKNYAQRDIKYWKEQNPDKLSVDEQGRTYKPVIALEFLNVYGSQEEWEQAAKEAGTSQMELPIDKNGEPDPVLEAVKGIIPTLVQQCETDMKALQEKLNHPPFDKFSLQDDIVKMAVAKFVATRAGQSVEEQEKLLAEINGHFDVPYLLIDSSELVKQLEQIAF